MKRIILLFLIIGVLLSFVSCGGKKTLPETLSCESVLEEIEKEIVFPKAEKIYLKSQNNFDAFSMSLWSDGAFKQSEEAELIEDYAIFLSAGAESFEVAIIKFKTPDEKAVGDLLERRKTTLSSGDKGAYDPDFELRMENAVIYNDGRFGILLITEDNSKALKVLEGLKE